MLRLPEHILGKLSTLNCRIHQICYVQLDARHYGVDKLQRRKFRTVSFSSHHLTYTRFRQFSSYLKIHVSNIEGLLKLGFMSIAEICFRL